MVIILNVDGALRSKLESHRAVTTILTDLVTIGRLDDPEKNIFMNLIVLKRLSDMARLGLGQKKYPYSRLRVRGSVKF